MDGSRRPNWNLQPWNGNDPDWMGAMLTYYAKATNVLICPSAPNRGNPNNGQPAGEGRCSLALDVVESILRFQLWHEQMVELRCRPK